MDFDFTPFFKRYEEISAMADQVFEKVREKHPDAVTCESRCADCCYALFDLTLIEALYINHHFNLKFSGQEREDLLDKANKADRRIHKIKRKAFKDASGGKDEAEVLATVAEERERCPMLNDKNLCELYDYRPITCRLYGIPTAIAGKGYTCGKSGFVKGRQYPTVNIDGFQKMLYELSHDLANALKSRHNQMGDILVPLSMAVLTDYDAEYLGVPTESTDSGPSDPPKGASDA